MGRRRKSGYSKEQEEAIEAALQVLIKGATNYGAARANPQAEPAELNRARLQQEEAVDAWYATVIKIQAGQEA